MKTAASSLVCLLWSVSMCLAEPVPSPAPSPTGLRDLASGEIDQLTLEINPNNQQMVSFHAFGARYVLSPQLIYATEYVSRATEIITQFRAAKYISVVTHSTGNKGVDGTQELVVDRIQFHYWNFCLLSQEPWFLETAQSFDSFASAEPFGKNTDVNCVHVRGWVNFTA